MSLFQFLSARDRQLAPLSAPSPPLPERSEDCGGELGQARARYWQIKMDAVAPIEIRLRELREELRERDRYVRDVKAGRYGSRVDYGYMTSSESAIPLLQREEERLRDQLEIQVEACYSAEADMTHAWNEYLSARRLLQNPGERVSGDAVNSEESLRRKIYDLVGVYVPR